MKYKSLEHAVNLFYKLSQENFGKNKSETKLETVEAHPEFNNLAKTIEPHIQKITADEDYSRDVPKGHPIAIAMVDSVVWTGFAHSDSDWVGAEPALLIRIAGFVDSIDFKRKPNVPPRKIKLNTEEGCLDYAYELIMLGGGDGSKYEFEYYEGPRDRIKGIRHPNSNFSRWVLVTFK